MRNQTKIGATLCIVTGVVIGILWQSNVRRSGRATTAPMPIGSSPASAMVGANAIEQLKMERAEHHALIREHDREAIDTTWATAIAATLKHDLESLAQGNHFEIESVDCRTTTCVGVVFFPSFAVARQNWTIIVSTPNHARCGTRATLDEPSDHDQRFKLQIVYSCNRSSADLTRAL
jgi:hypothetical protein